MASWQEFHQAAPDLAARVEARFTAARHHVLATLRRDGSPRVSGTEVDLGDGELRLGSMGGARKAADLRRDGRCAIHANPGDGTLAGGDAKVAGRAVEVADHPDAGTSHLFRVDVEEVVLTSLHPEGDRLLIEWWTPEGGYRPFERR